MASIDQEDQDYMINAVIHLANKDYASLVDDFIKLNILPTDCDRAAIIPLMDKALTPYVKGGGAKKYEEELKKLYGMEEDNMSSQESPRSLFYHVNSRVQYEDSAIRILHLNFVFMWLPL